MIEKQKQGYDSPMVELIEARVEKGFQMSGAAEPQTTGGTEGLTNSGANFGGNDFD